VQQRFGADKLAVILIDVDPGFFKETEQYLPRVKKVLERYKLDWPNAMAPDGFNDMVRVFNVSGYDTLVVDASGVVRGVNLHGRELERVVETIMEAKEADGPGQ
jgi:hypothetical protein